MKLVNADLKGHIAQKRAIHLYLCLVTLYSPVKWADFLDNVACECTLCKVRAKGAIWWRKLISSGCSAWNRTSKLILCRLLWRRRGALICCQRDEAPGPVPLSNTEALIHKTFHVFFSASSPDQTTKVTRFPLKSRLVNTSWASPLILVFIVFQFKESWFWCILPLRATSYFEVYFFFYFRLEKTQVLMRRMPRTQQPLSLLLVFP